MADTCAKTPLLGSCKCRRDIYVTGDLVLTADGASAEQDWFTRLSQDLLSNTLICSVDSVTRVLTT